MLAGWALVSSKLTHPSRSSDAGMVFHLPLSLCEEGRYGVTLSETVVITHDGCEVLANMERELFLSEL